MENGNLFLALAGGLLSLLFAYVPKLKDWYNTKDAASKQLFMLGLLAVITAATGLLSCANVVTSFLPVYACDQVGLISLLEAFGFAVIGNQAAYGATNYIKQ